MCPFSVFVSSLLPFLLPPSLFTFDCLSHSPPAALKDVSLLCLCLCCLMQRHSSSSGVVWPLTPSLPCSFPLQLSAVPATPSPSSLTEFSLIDDMPQTLSHCKCTDNLLLWLPALVAVVFVVVHQSGMNIVRCLFSSSSPPSPPSSLSPLFLCLSA